jgi:hypothetical protein
MPLKVKTSVPEKSEIAKKSNDSPAPSKRLTTIDTMKGMSIIMIFYCHFALIWHAADWAAFFRMQWLLLDFFGPAMFVTMSVLGTMLSAAKSADSPEHGSLYTRRSLLRISFLFILGELYNLTTVGSVGIMHVFEWNVFTAIAMFSLLMPLILRLKVRTRVLLIAIIVVLYYPLLNYSLTSINAAGIDPGVATPAMIPDLPTYVYFLFFQQAETCPIFSWLIVPLAASIIFEPFISKYNNATPRAIQVELRKIRWVGLILIVGAISLGYWLIPGYTHDIMDDLRVPGQIFSYPFSGVPVFLVRHTPQYLFYNLGIICVIFSFLAERKLVRCKQIPWEEKINNFGAMSLTGFLMSLLPYLVHEVILQELLFMVIFIPLIIVIVNFFWIWQKKFKIIGSAEWFMRIYVMFFSRLLDKRGMRTMQVTRTEP